MKIKSPWKGSQKTADIVKQEIAERWGEKEAEKYNPLTNCFPFSIWKKKGYHIKKGEKAIRSTTLIEKEIEENGKKAKQRYFKTVCLFYKLQVDK